MRQARLVEPAGAVEWWWVLLTPKVFLFVFWMLNQPPPLPLNPKGILHDRLVEYVTQDFFFLTLQWLTHVLAALLT